ncbi:unnamed protein product [Urochloa decumbens]|uniref:Uncharacterized protein n=1 Tax=Urochloa decumbens TaxID=240449 RepID=A0ABC8Z1K2_9POAL
MKLLVDTKSQRVLYAEAGEDAVDFLFSLLQMPGCVVDASGFPTGGSLVNLLCSVFARKFKLLDEALSGGGLVAGAASPAPAGAWCGHGPVPVMYTVMDDLKIAPMSTLSVITRMRAFSIKAIGALQEKTVQLGYDEALEMLKASLHSKRVLTDVFIGKNAPKCGFLSKRTVAKLVCGFLALPAICALVELVTQGRRL